MINPQDLLVLLHGKYSSLSIGFNESHACNYIDNLEEWYGEEDSHIEWVSVEEKQKAIESNSVWTIQWYPDTPVGFHCVGASTFEAAAKYALANESVAA